MKSNVGKIDQILRLVAAAALGGYGAVIYGQGGPALNYGLAFGIAAVIADTAAVRFCPAYALLGLKTCGTCCGGGYKKKQV